MNYVDQIKRRVRQQNPSQPEFVQAVDEVLESVRPVTERNEEQYRREALLERLILPERNFTFSVPWVDDHGQVHVNRGYRVQFNGSIGPYRVACDSIPQSI